mmetsp:Transcript_109/g.293  ORF Transcript_109/g.293 Transcript_109/m.293 type:complete len:338 (-) Transcript_109:87-1100(-)
MQRLVPYCFTCRSSKLSGHLRGVATWADYAAGPLHGTAVLGASPALLWTHGLAGCIASDDVRGLDNLFRPIALGRSVVRVDLDGHGKSLAASPPVVGDRPPEWKQHVDRLRLAASSMSRAFFGGEGMGACIALHAAVEAAREGATEAPPGLVLMRPPALLSTDGDACDRHRAQLKEAAATLRSGGYVGLEQLEASQGTSFMDGTLAVLTEDGPSSNVANELRRIRRDNVRVDTLAATMDGYAEARSPAHVAGALADRPKAMAADAYGVPMISSCPTLILAVPGDENHPVEAAERLAVLLPNSELHVAASLCDARELWGKRIADFLSKAWMKEFLKSM